MRLNVMCGRHVLEGWTNCDIQRSPHAKREPEVKADARSIPLPDGCADELMVIHGLEHYYRWEAPAALKEWRRLLKPGGLLVLELPNILKGCQNVLDAEKSGDERTLTRLGMWALYGDPSHEDPFMVHRWGWSPASLRAVLAELGFVGIKEEPTQWHSIGKQNRDMRIVASKAEHG